MPQPPEGDANDLVPVFIPALGLILAQAEKLKGSRLTEEEVLAVRDKAVCIMMPPDRAREFAATRPRDVHPDSCWPDWNRLRIQYTGNGFLPKMVLCLVGDDSFERSCRPLLEGQEFEAEWRGPDRRMVEAFQACACRRDPSLSQTDFMMIGKHSHVLYLVSKNFTADDAPGVAFKLLALGSRLLEAGAIAMKCESSGVAHSRERWLELAKDAQGETPWLALWRAFVQLPIKAEDDIYSCGMHLLGQPDQIVSADLLTKAGHEPEELAGRTVELFATFGLYLLGECLPGQFTSGHTFSCDAQSPRFRVLWEECTGYDEDDFFFNPFGRWRFTEA